MYRSYVDECARSNTMNGESVEVVSVKTKHTIKSGNGKPQLNIYHLFCIAFVAFWIGVVFASVTLNTRAVRTPCTPPDCIDDRIGSTFINRDTNFLLQINRSKKGDVKKNKLITRNVNTPVENEYIGEKKMILLYGNKVWNKYDKWHRYDWRQCPQAYSNCRITTDFSRLAQSSAVVYNAADMPSQEHVENIKTNGKIKRVFLSGLTPLRTKFQPKDFNNFFDLSITYKSESNIRIPYWPNDGLLPHMYRPRPEKAATNLTKNALLDLEDEIKHYFTRSGKEAFMAATITNCEDGHYPNLYMAKLQDEGLIYTYSLSDNKTCLKRMKETKRLPCHGELSDDCVKHFETFKFIVLPDDDLCKDYTTRKYWTSIFAWRTVPLLYGGGNYKKHLIPNSYIDCVGNEDYISPSFKKAYLTSQDPLKYYKTFHLWRHENRVETFHWQCELCRELNEKAAKTSKKIDMNKFWNKEKECGEQTDIHELMRLQFVRTGVSY